MLVGDGGGPVGPGLDCQRCKRGGGHGVRPSAGVLGGQKYSVSHGSRSQVKATSAVTASRVPSTPARVAAVAVR